MDAEVRLDERDAILVITLDRPKANAIDAETSRRLYDAVQVLLTRDDLRVGIITGAGHRFFSAGWDLKAASAGEQHDADHGPGGFGGLTQLFDCPKPVVAAVNGSAYGGGVELMLAAHLAVAAEGARFAFPEARLGILPDAGGLNRIPARLPRVLALELLLTGREFTSEEALAWGLVNRVVPQSEVLEESLKLAARLCESAPLSVAAILEAAQLTQGLSDQEAFQAIRQFPGAASIDRTEDAAEGVRAFAEGRPPRWSGR